MTDASASFDGCMVRLEEELAGVVEAVLACSADHGAAPVPEGHAGLAAALEAAHALKPAFAKAPAKDLTNLLWGIEDACALAHGYMNAVALAGNGDAAVRFEVTDRKSGRTVPVALPLESQAVVAADLRKRLRELKQLHKKLQPR